MPVKLIILRNKGLLFYKTKLFHCIHLMLKMCSTQPEVQIIL